MGYYTQFDLRAHNVKTQEEYEAIVEELKDYELYASEHDYGIFQNSHYYEDCKEAYFESYEEYKWYDHISDMIKLSKIFPDVTFRLSGIGEEWDDRWYEYYYNGEVEECRAEVYFPTPVNIKWEE